MPKILTAAALVAAALAGIARADETALPAWLAAHVGIGENQIAPVVLERARALYRAKIEGGKVKNPCYLAMDATRPHQVADGKAANRFYVICEGSQTFRAISAGHGSGNKMPEPKIENSSRCAKNFSNAHGSLLTMGGGYVTGEVESTFKGDYPLPGGKEGALFRLFVNYYGEGETENARSRDIGGHSSELVHHECFKKEPGNPNADKDGLVPFGQYESYPAGRSDGCTNWDPKEAPSMIGLLRDAPTTLYIYPAAADVEAVAASAKEGKPAAAYWNTECLKETGAPRYWPQEELDPLIAKWKASLPKPGDGAKKICAAAGDGEPTPANPGHVDEGGNPTP